MQVQQITIYQLVDSRAIGGIETHIFNLCQWLVSNGYRTQVLFLKDYGTPHPLEPKLEQANIEFKKLSGPVELYRLLNREPCLLSTHGYKAGLVGRVCGQLCNIPVVSTFHSGDLGKGRVRVYTWLDELTASLATQAMCVSEEISERLSCPSELIPNFVATRGLSISKGKQIAFVGRLSHEKGPDLFAEVTEGLPPCVQAHVYGDGVLRHTLQQVASHLVFHGNVSMEQHWHNIGLLCITSRHEGLPLAALEAMARGIPVVSFDIGALPKLISHGNNGWVINSHDISAFQHAIQSWLSTSSIDQHAIASAAQALIKRQYSSDMVCPKIVDIYCNALQQAPIYRIKPDKGAT